VRRTGVALTLIAAASLLSPGNTIAIAREGAQPRPAQATLPPRRPAKLPAPEAAPVVPKPSPQASISPPPSSAPAGAPLPPAEAGSCLTALSGVSGNRLRAAPPSASLAAEGCRVVEPVIVEALAVRRPDGPGSIKLVPPPTLSCDMARALSVWFDSALVPLARGALDKELASLRVGGGHECRRRNRQTQTPMSEHATGRALDIFAFQLGEERQGRLEISVEKPEGLVQTRFLDAVRQSACGAFMTALGPGSDAAHANHLHVDIQQRRTNSSRFCQ
jgi:hypothetical protein